MKTKNSSAALPLLESLLNTAVEMKLAPEEVERSYMARQLVQCTLPHSDPGNSPVWSRTNGKLTLAIRPYVDLKTRKALYPYGSIPRLLLFWIVTEATQKKSRHLKLGNSLDAFMREIGLNPRTGGGKRGDAARLHAQMERLFRAVITFEDRRENGVSYVDMQVGPKAMLWWDTGRSSQDNLWESWVELGEDFFAAITAAPVPVDTRALRALKRSPLALDLYAWLTHTAFVATKNRAPRVVPWEGLHAQMGAEYTQVRQFRAKVLLTLRKIRLVYPALQVDATKEELIVHPSPPAIPGRAAAAPQSKVIRTPAQAPGELAAFREACIAEVKAFALDPLHTGSPLAGRGLSASAIPAIQAVCAQVAEDLKTCPMESLPAAPMAVRYMVERRYLASMRKASTVKR